MLQTSILNVVLYLKTSQTVVLIKMYAKHISAQQSYTLLLTIDVPNNTVFRALNFVLMLR
jgi:hypothetical protein